MNDTILSKEDNLLKCFEEIHDYIYSNDGLSPQQTLEEFIKILFIKIYDENEKLNQFSITTVELQESKQGKYVNSLTERIANLYEKTQQAYQGMFNAIFCNLLIVKPNDDDDKRIRSSASKIP